MPRGTHAWADEYKWSVIDRVAICRICGNQIARKETVWRGYCSAGRDGITFIAHEKCAKEMAENILKPNEQNTTVV